MSNRPWALGCVSAFYRLTYLKTAALVFLAAIASVGGCPPSDPTNGSNPPASEATTGDNSAGGGDANGDGTTGGDGNSLFQGSNDNSDSGGNANDNDNNDPNGNSDGTFDPPVAPDATFGTFKNEPMTVEISGEISNAQPLTLEIISAPASGELSEYRRTDTKSASMTYTPAADFVGTAQFSYRVSVESGEFAVGTVTLMVYPKIRYHVTPTTGPRPLSVAAQAVVDANEQLPEGTYAWDVDGTQESGPMSTHSGRSFTLNTGGMHIVKLSVLLAGFAAPVGCSYDSNRGAADSQAEVTVWPMVSGTVRDSGGQPLAGVTMTADGAGASDVSDASGHYELNVPFDWSGAVRASAEGISFDPALRSFELTETDFDGADFQARTSTSTTVVLSGRVADASSAGIAGVSVSITDVPQALVTDADGRFAAQVTTGWSGTIQPSSASYTFAPPSTTLQNVTVDTDVQFVATPVGGGNHPPTVDSQNISAREDITQRIRLTGSDPDGDTLTFVIRSLPSHGTLVDDATGSVVAAIPFTLGGPDVTYAAIHNYFGFDTFTISASDGSDDSDAGTISITVVSENDAPVAQPQSVSTNEDTNLVVSLAGQDVENDPLSYQITALPSKGRLKDNGTGQFIASNQIPYLLAASGDNVTFVPNANANGGDLFQFKAYDGTAYSSAAQITVTINPVNDAPVASGQQVTTPMNTPLAITLTASDVDSANLTYSVVTNPAHGSLTGTAPAVTYTPAADYVGSDSFTFRANDGQANSANATVTISVSDSTWSAPIGIPPPAFGISERHTMYASAQWNYGSGLETYRNAGNGPYTHYVDNTSAASTDTNNTFGSPSKPRKTVPTTIPAGAVVELHGGPYTYNTGGVIRMTSQGTASTPVFVRGVSAAAKVMFSKPMEFGGQYMIVENMDLNAWSTSNDSGMSFDGTNHITIRHSEVRNGPDATTSAVAIGGNASQLVIYDVKIHDNGDWQATYDQDHHGVGVGDATDIWVLDCEMYHNSGDGIQINGTRATTQRIYVGRNTSWQNKQCGFWTKKASDVIFSQNTAYGHVPSDSSPGAGMGFQYGPERVWFIYNHIHDCVFGIMGASDGSNNGDNGNGQYVYAVGNVIHDIHAISGFDGGTAWTDGLAIHMRGSTYRYWVNNTIYDCDAGVAGTYGGEFHIENNLISNLTGANARHIFIEDSFSSSPSTVKNNLFGGTVRINWGGSTVYNLSSFQSGTGKGQSCVNANPTYVNPAGEDFRLQSGSAGVNSGLAADVFATFQTRYGLSIAVDPDGHSRPTGGAYDMGCYER